MDTDVPHSINHLVTGFLGSEEIVAACCDDGEVYAYYTRDIAEWISSQDKSPLAHPSGPRRPRSASVKLPAHFFRENVGMTAWGLAIHQKSRLIAVSSNRCEVTVFAPALDEDAEGRPSTQGPDDSVKLDARESFVRERTKNWRIVLALEYNANNIPNICFVDDDQGEAEKVFAIDIDGYTWIADIWRIDVPVKSISPSAGALRRSEENIGEESRGWGVLVIPDESFVTVGSLDELIGGKHHKIIRPTRTCRQPIANVEPCIHAIPENPCPDFTPGLDRAHNIHILPGQNALHAIANFLGSVVDLPSEDSDEDDMPTDENFDAPTDDDEEDEADEGVTGSGGEEVGNANIAVPDDEEMFDESEESSSADEYIEEAVVDTVLGEEASTQAAMTSHGAPQTSILPGAGRPLTYQDGYVKYRKQIMADRAHAAEPDIVSWRQLDADMVYLPHSGTIMPLPRDTMQLSRFLKRSREFYDGFPGETGDASKKYHFIRFYEKDIEMRTVRSSFDEENEIGIYCPNTLTFGGFHDRTLRPHFRATSRLNMVMHVPELSLVVVGSPTGRVLLLTPTRLASRLTTENWYWSHGLRVEWVLPRSSDDNCTAAQRRPLHGIAIGPVQGGYSAGTHDSSRASIPRRFRLMLHYRNHDIATFEITRQEQTGKLCIF